MGFSSNKQTCLQNLFKTCNLNPKFSGKAQTSQPPDLSEWKCGTPSKNEWQLQNVWKWVHFVPGLIKLCGTPMAGLLQQKYIDLKPKHVLAIIYCIMNSHTPLCKNIDLQYIKEDEINKLGTCAYGGKIIGILAKEDNIKWGYIILFAGYMLTYKTYTSLYILASEYLFFLWKFEVCHK